MVSGEEGRLRITFFVDRDFGGKSGVWIKSISMFVDFQQYIAMRELGIPRKLINLVKMTLKSTQSKVRVAGGDSWAFLV